MNKKFIILIVSLLLVLIIVVALMIKYKNLFERASVILNEQIQRDTDIEKMYDRKIEKTQIIVKTSEEDETQLLVTIIDNNDNPFIWDTNYILEKKDKDTWKEVEKNIDEKKNFAPLPKIDLDNCTYQEIKLKDDYGELEKGSYRIVKNLKTSIKDIYIESNEFEINN